MATRRLRRPLDRGAVKQADDAFYARHPELVGADGGREPLAADSPQTDEWRQLYLEHGGQLEPDEPAEENRDAGAPVEPCPLGQQVLFDRIRWVKEQPQASKGTVQQVWSDQYVDEQVGVLFRAGTVVQIELRLAQRSTVRPRSLLPVELERQEKPGRFVVKELTVDRQKDDLVYVDVPHDELAAALAKLGGRLNLSFLRCHVPAERSLTGKRIKAPNLACPLLQQPLYFLPGVLGSELSVVNHKGSVEECFPEVAVLGDLELELLCCKRDGSPHRPVVRDRLKVLDCVFLNVGPFVVYKCKAVVDRMVRRRFPAVYKDAGKKDRILPVLYRDVPYDWRLDIAKSHLELAKEIRGYFDEMRKASGPGKAHPFLAGKIALAGHSTGGVVMRGLATTQNALAGLIEHCFFINVPHLGAPKAEFVYLSGDMEVPLVTNKESFRQMGPDMPIVYFLSANARYGTAVGADWSPTARQRRVQAAIDAGAYRTGKKKLYGYPAYASEGPLTFNMNLAVAAERYCESSVVRGRAADVRSFVFHSGGRPTVSGTRVQGSEAFADKALIGDGTVPTVSQIADIGGWQHPTLFKPTPKNPEHVPAPNSTWIWHRVMDVLVHRSLSSYTMPFPTDMLALCRMLIDIARDVWRGKDWQDLSAKVSLGPGESRTHDHKHMDYGIALVQCHAGTVQVEASRAVWWTYGVVKQTTVSAGKWAFLEIPRQKSKLDQDNRVKVTAKAAAARYTIDMVSCDV